MNNEIVLREVKNLITNSVDEIIKIKTENQIIEASLEHPFYIKEKGWVEAKDLQQDDILITLNHEEKIKNHHVNRLIIRMKNEQYSTKSEKL